MTENIKTKIYFKRAVRALFLGGENMSIRDRP